jgi:acetoin utilization protein AcuC
MIRAVLIAAPSLWAGGHPPGHPLRPERLQNSWEMMQACRSLSGPNIKIVPPRLPSDEELLTFHTADYIAAVHALSRGEKGYNPRRYGFGSGDNPIFGGMFESEALKVGGSLVGAELLLNGDAEVVFNFAGGLHHATPDSAAGFCVFGDGVIAIKRLLAAGKRVAYIDVDAHHGDGVQAAFYDDPRVLTISFHESGLYLFPGTGFIEELGEGAGYGYTVNVPLLPFTDDDSFIWAFEELVPRLVARFAPDVIVTQLGVDAHWRDPLAHLCLTTYSFEVVCEQLKRLALPWLVLGGGGYEANVVPRVWTLAWGIMSGQTLANELPPALAMKYDLAYLRDDEPAPVSGVQYQLAQSEAAMVVARLKTVLKLR